jgi:DNA polymerase-3 subunit epsilon
MGPSSAASKVSWLGQPVHFIDFEGNRRSGILEYGIATLQEGRIVSTSTRLCRATGHIRADETEFHGLRESDVAAEAPFSAEWELFCRLRTSGPLAAHFAGTENGLLKAVWPYPRLSPDFARPGENSTEWGPWIDSASLFAELRPQSTSGRLEQLIADCGLQAELDSLAAQHCPESRRRYHAALYDAIAGALLLALLARDPAASSLSLLQVLTLSTRNGEKRDKLRQGSLF